jgi:hypothetical protein
MPDQIPDANTGILPVQSTQPDGVAAARQAEADLAAKQQADAAAAATSKTADGSFTPSEVEALAMELGWNPNKEDLGDAFVDAKEFIKKTKNIQNTQARTIRDQNRKLDKVLGTVESLKTHYEKVAEARQREFDEKITALKAERRAAIAENDPAKVDALDDRIDAIKEAKTKDAAAVTAKPAGDTVLEEWAASNPWYGEDKEKTAFAHKRARLYRISEINDDDLYLETLEEIGREVEAAFPAVSKKRVVAPAGAGGVEGAAHGTAARTTGNGTFTRANLDEEHRKAYDSFVELGVDGKKIIEDWVRMGELK